MEDPLAQNVDQPSNVFTVHSRGEMDEIDNLTKETSAIVLESVISYALFFYEIKDVDVRVYSKRVEEQLENLEASAVEACMLKYLFNC